MELKEFNRAELTVRFSKAYRRFAWRIMIYLQAHPTVLNDSNNIEIFDRVRDIQVQYHQKKHPETKHEDIIEFVDLMCELEANKYGAEYFVEQKEMELYRQDTINSEEQNMLLYIILMAYDDNMYTKTIHELVISEEDD